MTEYIIILWQWEPTDYTHSAREWKTKFYLVLVSSYVLLVMLPAIIFLVKEW